MVPGQFDDQVYIQWLAAAANLALAEWQGAELSRRDGAGSAAARVAHHGRTVQREGGGQHLPAFRFIRGGHDNHVRDAANVGEVEGAMVRRAIGTDQTAAVDGEDD